LNQTFTDFEIICINDASTDHSPEILQEYAAKDGRVRVLHHGKNTGMAAARNTGLDAAAGEYIAFCDSDDYIQPDMFKIMYTEITKNDSDLVICNAYKTREHDKPVFLKNVSYAVKVPSNSFMHKYYEEGEVFPVWNKLYKRSVIASIRFDPELFGTDDGHFNMCLAPFIKKYVMVDARLYGWRQRGDSNGKSRAKLSKKVEGYCRWIEKIQDPRQNLRFSSKNKAVFCSQIAAFLSADMLVNYGYAEVVYASKPIADLYSRGFIDFSHARFLEKIMIAPFVILGKIQQCLKDSISHFD
jgi:glycosyltransferase involved in cell wall biosynthesis